MPKRWTISSNSGFLKLFLTSILFIIGITEKSYADNLVLECNIVLSQGANSFNLKRRYVINIDTGYWSMYDNFGSGFTIRGENIRMKYADRQKLMLFESQDTIHWIDRTSGEIYSKEYATGDVRRGECQKTELPNQKF